MASIGVALGTPPALPCLLVAGACAGAPATATPPPSTFLGDWPAAARPAAGEPTGLPAGFSDELVVGGLSLPTALRFLPSGDLLVAEKRGVVTRFDGADATDSAVLIDVRTAVFNWNQFGLLGLGVDPDFADQPFARITFSGQ